MVNTRSILKQRRQNLANIFPHPVMLWAGSMVSRNFPANHYYYRSSSHFLYFTNLNLANAVIYLHQGELILFWNPPSPDSVMWYGELPTVEEIAEKIQAQKVLPLDKLSQYTQDVVTIPAFDTQTYQQQCTTLERILPFPDRLTGQELQLAQTIVKLRLVNDDLALAEIQQAVDVSVKAHKKAIQSVTQCDNEAQVRGVIEGEIIAHNMSCAYNSIVTVNGDVLHNDRYHNSFEPNDLLLVDVGAQTINGWASDITRTYPVNGKFSSSQKDIYQIVLTAHDRCIDRVKEGVEYKQIHQLACLVLIEGLIDLRILQGKPEDLLAQNVHSLFFPHGVGHLMGLDVHDMEDIGDIAGYGDRSRSELFGLKYLRLDRILHSSMVITIEPGFYQIPSILANQKLTQPYQGIINWDKLALFSDVKGIRIEDDVLVTATGNQVLSQNLPTTVTELETQLIINK